MSPTVKQKLEKVPCEDVISAAQSLGFVLKDLVEKQPCAMVIDGVDECSLLERRLLFEVLENTVSTRN